MFEPWAGERYREQSPPKMLILGESHYGEHHLTYKYELSKKTILTIEDRTKWNLASRFHTKLASALLGHRPTPAEAKSFWHSVAYHNLITSPVVTSRRAPTVAQWQESLPTLDGIITHSHRIMFWFLGTECGAGLQRCRKPNRCRR